MAVGAAQDKTEAIEARKQVPPQFLPRSDVSLTAKFSMKNVDANGDGFLNEQELRSLAIHLVKLETEEELRAALSGVLSGRLLEGFFKHRNEALQKAAKEDRKARDDMYYMALLQAQLDAINNELKGLEPKLFTPEELEALKGLSGEERIRKGREMLDGKLERGEVSQADYERWLLLEKQKQEISKELSAESAKIKGPIDEDNITSEQKAALALAQQLKETTRKSEAAAIKVIHGKDKSTNSWGRKEELDSFIENLDDKTKLKMLEDPSTEAFLLERLRVDKFNSMYEKISKLKGQPTYERALSGVLSRLDNETKDLLRKDENTPQDAKKALAVVAPSTSHAKALDSEKSTAAQLQASFNSKANAETLNQESGTTPMQKIATLAIGNNIA